nr:zinc dependent phospholipase C family protein [Sedimentibacter sp.]
MPATYAHYTFGQQVLNQLDGELKRIVSNNLDLFHIGLHGPDILFYYKPLNSNTINKAGHELHRLSAKIFFEKSKNIINTCNNSEGACAYIIGYICHFMLDSECHPYIRKHESDKLTHSEIETEFERMLMEKNNLEPLSFRPTSHIIPKSDSAKCISWFYEGISMKEILSALKSMKLYLNILVAPGYVKRRLIISALKLSGNYYGMIGLIMNYEKNPECIQINKNLYELYSNVIVPTVNLVNEFYENLNNIRINERFNRTFG